MKIIPVFLIAVIIIVAGCASQTTVDTNVQGQNQEEISTGGTQQGASSNSSSSSTTNEQNEQTTNQPENKGTYGVELAKNYYRYNETHYLEARQRNMKFETMILLHFTADNCEYCNEQENVLREAFNSIDQDGVIGYEVHYDDSETNDEDRAVSEGFTQDPWNGVGPDSKAILDKYYVLRRTTERYTVETAVAAIEEARAGFGA